MTLADAIVGFVTGEHRAVVHRRRHHRRAVRPAGDEEGSADTAWSTGSRSCRRGPHPRALVDRQGSRVLGDLCTTISGGELGQRNATENLNRYVPALTYRAACMFGIQPVYLRGPLADVDGGLPQRFWFVRLSGHLLKIGAEVPADILRLPDVSEMRFPGGFVNVPNRIRREIVAAHVERMQAADWGNGRRRIAPQPAPHSPGYVPCLPRRSPRPERRRLETRAAAGRHPTR